LVYRPGFSIIYGIGFFIKNGLLNAELNGIIAGGLKVPEGIGGIGLLLMFLAAFHAVMGMNKNFIGLFAGYRRVDLAGCR
jgi:hypothetical protein